MTPVLKSQHKEDTYQNWFQLRKYVSPSKMDSHLGTLSSAFNPTMHRNNLYVYTQQDNALNA